MLLHDVLAHQVDVSIKPFLADSSVNGLEEVLTHVDFSIFGAKIMKNKLNQTKSNARIWDMTQMRALETGQQTRKTIDFAYTRLVSYHIDA